MRIGIIQMRCEKAKAQRNTERIARLALAAEERSVDILAFPEMCLPGYVNASGYGDVAMDVDGPEIGRVARLTEGYDCSMLIGILEKNGGDKPFITQVALRGGRVVGSYRKNTIPDDESAWYSAGSAASVFSHDDIAYGLSICADVSNESVFRRCAEQGARIVFEVAAPGLYGEQATRNWKSGYEWWEGECRRYLSEYAKKYGLWIAVATQAGRTMDEDFPGGGYVFSPSGDRLYATDGWEEGAAFIEIDEAAQTVTEIGK